MKSRSSDYVDMFTIYGGDFERAFHELKIKKVLLMIAFEIDIYMSKYPPLQPPIERKPS